MTDRLNSNSAYSKLRRNRWFLVDLLDPAVDPHPVVMQPGDFAKPYEGRVRPLLAQMDECSAFLPPPRPAGAASAPGRTAHTQKLQETWKEVGARPEVWLASYFHQSADHAVMDLRSRVLDDQLFWWWALVGGSGVGLVFFVPFDAIDAPSLFRGSYNPRMLGRFALARRAHFLYAKRQTARTDRVAFIIDALLRLVVIANGANVEALYAQAMKHAVQPDAKTLKAALDRHGRRRE